MEVWPFMPQLGTTESLEWATDVQRFLDGEQRRGLRPFPRQDYLLKYQMGDAQFNRARELAKYVGGSDLLLPLWFEFELLGAVTPGQVTIALDTTYKTYESGGRVLLWQADDYFEVCTISSIEPGLLHLSGSTQQAYSDTVALPLVVVAFDQAFGADRLSVLSMTEARFRAQRVKDLSGETGLGYGSFESHPLVSDSRIIAGSARDEYEREVEVLDSVSGAVARSSLFYNAVQRSNMSWSTYNDQQLWDLRCWLHAIRGRQKSFWVMSWSADLALSADVLTGATTVEIVDVNYNAVFPSSSRFAIRRKDGTLYPFRVASAAAGDPGKEVLTLTSEVTEDVYLADVDKVCRLNLYRLDSDRVELTHITRGQANVTVPLMEVQP